MRLCSRQWAIAACAVLIVLAAACGSDDDPPPAGEETATPAAIGMLTNADGWPRVENLRGVRYCEVLLARVIDARLNAEVWNTFGLNDCPEAEWRALDPALIKTEHAGVVAVLLNGPRYWLTNAIERQPTGEDRVTAMFGSLEMFRVATVDIGPIPPNLAPYTERRTARETIFEYAAGDEVHELVTNDGRVFIMQSYSLQNDATLTEATLSEIVGSKIAPPAGWTFRSRTLDEPLRVRTADGIAVVLQDELSNTYQLIPSDQ